MHHGDPATHQMHYCDCLKRTKLLYEKLGSLTLYSSLNSLPSSAERSLYSSSRWSTGMGKYVLEAEEDLGRRTTVCCSAGSKQWLYYPSYSHFFLFGLLFCCRIICCVQIKQIMFASFSLVFDSY